MRRAPEYAVEPSYRLAEIVDMCPPGRAGGLRAWQIQDACCVYRTVSPPTMGERGPPARRALQERVCKWPWWKRDLFAVDTLTVRHFGSRVCASPIPILVRRVHACPTRIAAAGVRNDLVARWPFVDRPSDPIACLSPRPPCLRTRARRDGLRWRAGKEIVSCGLPALSPKRRPERASLIIDLGPRLARQRPCRPCRLIPAHSKCADPPPAPGFLGFQACHSDPTQPGPRRACTGRSPRLLLCPQGNTTSLAQLIEAVPERCAAGAPLSRPAEHFCHAVSALLEPVPHPPIRPLRPSPHPARAADVRLLLLAERHRSTAAFSGELGVKLQDRGHTCFAAQRKLVDRRKNLSRI